MAVNSYLEDTTRPRILLPKLSKRFDLEIQAFTSLVKRSFFLI